MKLNEVAGRQNGAWAVCIGERFMPSALRAAPATQTIRQAGRQTEDKQAIRRTERQTAIDYNPLIKCHYHCSMCRVLLLLCLRLGVVAAAHAHSDRRTDKQTEKQTDG